MYVDALRITYMYNLLYYLKDHMDLKGIPFRVKLQTVNRFDSNILPVAHAYDDRFKVCFEWGTTIYLNEQRRVPHYFIYYSTRLSFCIISPGTTEQPASLLHKPSSSNSLIIRLISILIYF